mgnify:CR=1 FL=1
MSYQLVIAEDDHDMARLIGEIASEAGFDTHIYHTGAAAAAALRKQPIDVLLTDLRLPAPDGMKLLQLAKELDSEIIVIMITGYATVNDAVAGFKLGLYDLLGKPFNNDQLRALLLRVQDFLKHRQHSEQLAEQLARLDIADEPLMLSRSAQHCLQMAQQVAPLDVPVLIQGESGTGKGVMARHIHKLSQRRDGPYFALNCASVAESLVENELFGHEKGAYTGATERKRGLLELADGGTLLLDEINSTSMETQAKLLHFMQERSLLRVGGERQVDIDVRLLVASNENLVKLVEEGRFRRDLYYRLNVFPIDLPPLRERREDIAPLAESFLQDYAQRYASSAQHFSIEALALLQNYHWPGNIRELENIVQRAVILTRGPQVDVSQLPQELHDGKATPSLGHWPADDASLAEVEMFWIQHMLECCEGNKTEAARRLGVDVSTLHRKLKEHTRTNAD